MEILNSSFFMGMATALAIILVRILSKSFFTVEEGMVAICESLGKTFFLDEKNKKLKLYGAGFHWKLPWWEVKVVSVMEQFWDLETEKEGNTILALDGTSLKVKSGLRFSLLPDRIYHYLLDLDRPEEHIKGLFVCLLQQEIARFKDEAREGEIESSYAHIRQEKGELHQRLINYFGDKTTHRYGIKFDALDLVDILPPEELAEALNALLNAQAETQAQFARAQADCANKVLAAKEGLAIAQQQGVATETEILTLGENLKELANSNTLELYIERRKSEVVNDSKTIYVRA